MNNKQALFSVTTVTYRGILAYPQIDIEENKTTFLSGESGSGKSTLLKLLSGVASYDAGSVQYRGQEVTAYDSIALRREVLLCGQTVYLFDGSIRDNFRKYYAYRDLPAPEDAVIRDILTLCVANFPLDAMCASMSGGERQRIYTAIYLSFMPRVLLLDEPTSALDAKTALAFFESITGFCRKKKITLIVVSHDKILTERFADAVIVLGSGRE